MEPYTHDTHQVATSQPNAILPLKNSLLALGLMLFLAVSFKLAGGLTVDTTLPVLSQTDSVLNSLFTSLTQTSANPASQAAAPIHNP